MTIVTTEPGLAALLREQTRIAHEHAETAPFVRQLIGGELPITAYAALAAQNHAIYSTLEELAEGWRGDPIAGPFVLDELTRTPQLEHDLARLLGPDWRTQAERLRVPATDRYVAHLRRVCADWPGGFVAHHYVRYLGDLSGGQVIRQALHRIYGDVGDEAGTFYFFERIDKIKPFRDHYRDLLDQAPLTDGDRERVIAEAIAAFELNRAVFVDLGARCQPVDDSAGRNSGPRADGGDDIA
jgi:heme oxygenase